MRLAIMVFLTVVCLVIARDSAGTPELEKLAWIAAVLCGAFALIEAILLAEKKGR